ncbi:MAG: zinc finger domain-containing protein [Candidatus Woesearchaeota archaeon]
MTKEIQCISCKKNQINCTGTIMFKCPQCGKFEIVRCKKCREIATPYVCPECGFNGPA